MKQRNAGPVSKSREVPSRGGLPVELIAMAAISTGLILLFWWPLVMGGGLIGGDTYTYFFPQKVAYADELQSGRLALWNPFAGHGYPTLAESQTGTLYPPNLLLYLCCDVNTAYHVSQLIHYFFTPIFFFLYARRIGLGKTGAAFAAGVYTYSWFPPRICLEWAIIGGMYLPLLLLFAHQWISTRRTKFLILFAVALGLQLLAGHYNLAFIALVAVGVQSAAQVLFPQETDSVVNTAKTATENGNASSAALKQVADLRLQESRNSHQLRYTVRPLAILAIAVALGFGVAAVQVVPTWELKTRSQRITTTGERFSPAYGHIPPLYLFQFAMPLAWYRSDINLDAAIGALTWGSFPAGTNKVEAHLYFGVLPLLLALGGLVSLGKIARPLRRILVVWLCLSVFSVAMATGWPLVILQYVPGFSFFSGPGRYGILITAAVSLFAGWQLGAVLARWKNPVLRGVFVLAVALATAAELGWVSRIVTYAFPVPNPPITQRDNSIIRKMLLAEPSPPRLFAPGQNLPTLLGVSATPVYLGIGPSEYYAPDYPMVSKPTDDPERLTAEQLTDLERAGVTHLLRFIPLANDQPGVQLVYAGMDELLSRAWARFQEPLFLYRLSNAPGRVRWRPASSSKDTPTNTSAKRAEAGEPAPKITRYTANQIEIVVDSVAGGQLMLADLDYPGWVVRIDGTAAAPSRLGIFRAVNVDPGQHVVTWAFEPWSIRIGGLVSVISIVTLVVASLLLLRKRRKAIQ